MTGLTSKQLRHTANLQAKIKTLQRQLRKLLGSDGARRGAAEIVGRKKHTLSAAARAKISAAAKARWAKVKKAKK